MGFLPDVRRILTLLPQRRQNLLFSATLAGPIAKLAHGLLDDPESIDLSPRNIAVETVDQRIYRVDTNRKVALLTDLFVEEQWDQVLIFTRTKHRANRVATALTAAGVSADAIHGNKSQAARTRALAAFKAGRMKALVATDIASRGLDISGLPQVVNYELPFVPEDYVHRIGRTGRAGAGGNAVSLVCTSENNQLRAIERLLGRTIPADVIEGFEPDPTIRHEPVTQGRGRRPQPGRYNRSPSSRGGGRSDGGNNGRSNAQRRRRPPNRAGAAPARSGPPRQRRQRSA
jgi:ATP-dependent RNA helicase RhlE